MQPFLYIQVFLFQTLASTNTVDIRHENFFYQRQFLRRLLKTWKKRAGPRKKQGRHASVHQGVRRLKTLDRRKRFTVQLLEKYNSVMSLVIEGREDGKKYPTCFGEAIMQLFWKSFAKSLNFEGIIPSIKTRNPTGDLTIEHWARCARHLQQRRDSQ